MNGILASNIHKEIEAKLGYNIELVSEKETE